MKKIFQKVTAIMLTVLLIVAAFPLNTVLALGEDSDVASVSAVCTMEFVENVDGYFDYDYIEDEEVSYFVYNWWDYLEFTFELENGDIITSESENYWDYCWNGLDYTPNQSYDSQWGVGTHTADFTYREMPVSVDVDVIETPVANVNVAFTSDFIKNHTGYPTTEYVDGELIEYFVYDWWNYLEFTLELKSGETVTPESDEYYDYILKGFRYTNNQSSANPWDVGTHSVNITFWNVPVALDIEIIETPVKSVTAVCTNEFIVGIDGNIVFEYVNDEEVEYRAYNWWEYLDFTIELKSGEIITPESENYWDYRYNAMDYDFAQSYDNQWGVGTHTVNFTFLNVPVTVDVEVIENPIKSVSGYLRRPLVKNADGFTDYDYLEDEPTEYFLYDWWNYVDFTIELNSGEILTVESEDYDFYRNNAFDFTNEQNHLNQWGVGSHTVNMTLWGKPVTIDIVIEDIPIRSVTAYMEKQLIENIDAASCVVYDEYGQSFEYKMYDWWNYVYFVVELTNGETVSPDVGDYDYYVWSHFMHYDEQTYENQWELGTHTVTCSLWGVPVSVDVEVVESPVKSVSAVMTKQFIEGFDGVRTTEIVDGEEKEYYVYLWRDFVDFTIELKNGDIITPESEDYEYYYWNGMDFNYEQNYYNQLGVDTHTVEFTFWNIPISLEIEIIDSPIKSVSAVCTKQFVENIDGYYSENPDIVDSRTFIYNWWEYVDFTIEMNSGEIIPPESEDYWYYRNAGFVIDNEQNYLAPWGVGTHTVNFTFWGKPLSLDIEVVETPVKKVTASMSKNLIEGVDGYLETNYGELGVETEHFVYYWWSFADFTIELKSGEIITPESENYWDYRYVGFEYPEQDYENRWGVGTHTLEFTFWGVPVSLDVTVEETPVKSATAVCTRQFIKGVNGLCYTYYDESGETDYFIYDWWNSLDFTIELKSGEIITRESEEYWDYCWDGLIFETNQDFENQWDVGLHTVEFTFWNVPVTLEVELIENPVTSVTAYVVQPLKKNIDGYFNYDDNDDEYFEYEWSSYLCVSFTHENGKTVTVGDDDYDRYLECGLRYDDEQYYNHWDAGKHTVAAHIFGIPVDITVNIVAYNEEPIFAYASTFVDYSAMVIKTYAPHFQDISNIVGVQDGYSLSIAPSDILNGVNIYGTGSLVTVYDSESKEIATYTLVVMGDLNGDSYVDVLDAMLAQKSANNGLELDFAFALAADFNDDSDVDTNDFQQVLNMALR